MREKLAIIGSGVSGIVSAYLLQDKFDVTIYEIADRIGGHTNTIVIPDGMDRGVGIDTGFIVLNDRNYPLFTKFLAKLNVPTRWSDMSFGYYSDSSKFLYAGTNLSGLFADRMNLIRPKFYRFLWDLRTFCLDASEALQIRSEDTETIGEFVWRKHYGTDVIKNYIIPMTSAIWSCPEDTALEYPAISLFRFFQNHGLLSIKDRPRWQTVVGGSHSYLKAFRNQFRGNILLQQTARTVRREVSGVIIEDYSGSTEKFDRIIIATHADQAINILEHSTPLEQRLLRPWRYQRNRGYLHSDDSILPPNRRGWASWNVREITTGIQSGGRSVTTYYMNLLQGLKSDRNYCVSFDCDGLIDQSRIIAPLDYMHPIYDRNSNATQPELPLLNNQGNRTYFVGSYFGYGFHEDAVRSANEVAKLLGGSCLD
jgi:predicted NAD/FAD-binding protein